jgi:DNA-binding CsgD family transcriptional regulator
MIQERTAPQELKSLLASNPHVQAMLYQKAKDRASPLRWNTNILILVSVNLITTILLTMWGISNVIIGVVAAAGLLLVWAISLLQEKRLEKKFFLQEIQNFSEIIPAEPTSKNTSVGVTAAPALGAMPITHRELEILTQMASGKVNKEIATALNISAMTVKNHISHILDKLDVSDRTSAVLLAVRNGWITLDTP